MKPMSDAKYRRLMFSVLVAFFGGPAGTLLGLLLFSVTYHNLEIQPTIHPGDLASALDIIERNYRTAALSALVPALLGAFASLVAAYIAVRTILEHLFQPGPAAAQQPSALNPFSQVTPQPVQDDSRYLPKH